MIAEHVRDTPMGHLMRLMSLDGAPQELEAVCRTSDGFYFGQVARDLGYNQFLGCPSVPPTEFAGNRAREFWESLNHEPRLAVIALTDHPPDGSPIPLRDFGIDPEIQTIGDRISGPESEEPGT